MMESDKFLNSNSFSTETKLCSTSNKAINVHEKHQQPNTGVPSTGSAIQQCQQTISNNQAQQSVRIKTSPQPLTYSMQGATSDGKHPNKIGHLVEPSNPPDLTEDSQSYLFYPQVPTNSTNQGLETANQSTDSMMFENGFSANETKMANSRSSSVSLAQQLVTNTSKNIPVYTPLTKVACNQNNPHNISDMPQINLSQPEVQVTSASARTNVTCATSQHQASTNNIFRNSGLNDTPVSCQMTAGNQTFENASSQGHQNLQQPPTNNHYMNQETSQRWMPQAINNQDVRHGMKTTEPNVQAGAILSPQVLKMPVTDFYQPNQPHYNYGTPEDVANRAQQPYQQPPAPFYHSHREASHFPPHISPPNYNFQSTSADSRFHIAQPHLLPVTDYQQSNDAAMNFSRSARHHPYANGGYQSGIASLPNTAPMAGQYVNGVDVNDKPRAVASRKKPRYPPKGTAEYLEHRRKNNEAVRRSRAKQKLRQIEQSQQLENLRRENSYFRHQLNFEPPKKTRY